MASCKEASPEDEIAKLVKLKARKHALHGEFYNEDPDDIEQELWIKWEEIRSRYSGDRGALVAFVDVALNNHLKNLAASRRTLKRGGQGQGMRSRPASESKSAPFRPPESLSDLEPEDDSCQFDFDGTAVRIDVRRALRKLRPELRDIALRRNHQGVTEIAEDMGISRETVYQKLRLIQQLFRDLGLDEYLS